MSKRPPVCVSVERHVEASPETFHDLIADVTRMGEWSPETVRQDVASPLPVRLLQKRAGVTDRSAHLAAGMATTLERLDAAVTAA